jgi:site-specific DNA-methyltransferase (adenine-specific)
MAGGKQMKTVWSILPPSNGEKAQGKHPTQKPVALVERCVLASTEKGALILDPFLGNGTTAVAAVMTGRACVGVELDKQYVEMAVKRVESEIETRRDLFFPRPD